MNKRKLSVINEIICHINDSKYPKHDAKVIDNWHKERFSPAPTGDLKYIGYHFVILFDGTIQKGRELEWYGQHCAGNNWPTIGICLQGNAETEFTQDQMQSLENLVIDLKNQIPTIKKVSQHSDYDNKKPFCAGITVSQKRYLNTLVQ